MGQERSAGFLIFRRWNSKIEYLLLKASQMNKNWTPPKGHVELGEDDITAALREAKEEAGYSKNDLHIYKECFKCLHYKVKTNDKSVVYWLAELNNPQKKPKLSHEHTEFRWLTKDDAILLNGFDDFAEMINYLHDEINSISVSKVQTNKIVD